MTTAEIFKQCMKKWYEWIGPQHHKDRDCHFFIYKSFERWDYGEQKQFDELWCLRHHGYLLGEIDESFDTLEDLQAFLIYKLDESTGNFQKFTEDDFDWANPKKVIYKRDVCG